MGSVRCWPATSRLNKQMGTAFALRIVSTLLVFSHPESISTGIVGPADADANLLSLQTNANSQIARMPDARAQLSTHTPRPARITHARPAS